MITIEKVNDLQERLEALKGYLDIEEKRGRIQEEEKYTLDPDFWNDQKKAQGMMHKIRELKRWVELYEAVKREVDDTVNALTSLLEPILVVFLGALVGGIVVALYLPLFNIPKLIGNK